MYLYVKIILNKFIYTLSIICCNITSKISRYP